MTSTASPALPSAVTQFLSSIDFGSIEKEAAVIVLPYVVAGVNKIISDKATLDAYLASENSTLGGLIVSFVEANLKLPGMLAPLKGIIDGGIAAGEPQFVALAASGEQALETLAITFLQSIPAKLATFAGVAVPQMASAPASVPAAVPPEHVSG